MFDDTYLGIITLEDDNGLPRIAAGRQHDKKLWRIKTSLNSCGDVREWDVVCGVENAYQSVSTIFSTKNAIRSHCKPNKIFNYSFEPAGNFFTKRNKMIEDFKGVIPESFKEHLPSVLDFIAKIAVQSERSLLIVVNRSMANMIVAYCPLVEDQRILKEKILQPGDIVFYKNNKAKIIRT